MNPAVRKPAVEATILDVEKVRFLIQLGGNQIHFLTKLVDAFAASTSEILVHLKEPGLTAERMVQLGHKLRGLAGTVGALRVERVGQVLERAGTARDLGSLRMLAAEAEYAFLEAHQALLALIRK